MAAFVITRVVNHAGRVSTARSLVNAVSSRFFTNQSVGNHVNLKQELQAITDMFGEARDELEYAREALGKVYFSDDLKSAEELCEQVKQKYQGLLTRLESNERLDVEKRIGLKMEELKQELEKIKQEAMEE